MCVLLNRSRHTSGNSLQSGGRCSPSGSPPRQLRRPTDDHWHQSLCSAYLNVSATIFMLSELINLAFCSGIRPISAHSGLRPIGDQSAGSQTRPQERPQATQRRSGRRKGTANVAAFRPTVVFRHVNFIERSFKSTYGGQCSLLP